MARPDRIGTAGRTVRAALAVPAALAGAAVVGADPVAALPLGTPIVAVSTATGVGAGRVRAEGSGPQGYRWGSGRVRLPGLPVG
ncbi:hypothetical protein [Agilicoccus flavus]|uniref:hypothetical protein n=1 Tax=Agilicoccus flavus TaxID=2775968 RepID=UPI001CF6F6C1|nr:hypothetical protein [Agilicoccus flavus]